MEAGYHPGVLICAFLRENKEKSLFNIPQQKIRFNYEIHTSTNQV